MSNPRKLSEETREFIRRLWRERPTLKRLAHKYDVSPKTISRILYETEHQVRNNSSVPCGTSNEMIPHA